LTNRRTCGIILNVKERGRSQVPHDPKERNNVMKFEEYITKIEDNNKKMKAILARPYNPEDTAEFIALTEANRQLRKEFYGK
jgi:hypothetical protein